MQRADTCEASELGEGGCFNSTLLCALNLVDGFGAVGVGYEGGVGRVEDEELPVSLAELDELLQLRLGGACT